MDPVLATFFDGQSARAHAVQVSVVESDGVRGLLIRQANGNTRIWPAQDLRELTDQARKEGIVLQLRGHDEARLIIPHGHAEEAIRVVAPDLGKRDVSRPIMFKLLIWLGGAAASVALILLVILPALSDQLATMIPAQKEAALGRQTLAQIQKYLLRSESSLTCTKPAGRAALDKMVARLSKDAGIPYALNVQVFDHSLVNAFAVPGGNIVMFKGLIKSSDTPEEVAGVLAHEIGHVHHRDPTRLTLRTAGSAGILGMVFGDFAGGFAALAVTQKLINAAYTRDAEAGADAYAHELLAKSGLPSVPLAVFFENLKAKYGSEKGLLSHLASHPDLQGRANAARAADTIGEVGFTPVLSAAEWQDLKAICD